MRAQNIASVRPASLWGPCVSTERDCAGTRQLKVLCLDFQVLACTRCECTGRRRGFLMAEIGIVRVPASYEALREVVGAARIGQVLIACDEDLVDFKKYLAEVAAARQGKLVFVKGEPGQGKTTFVESTGVFLADIVGVVKTAPPDYRLPLTDLPRWLTAELPSLRRNSQGRLIVVNLDGREIPVLDEAATRASMANLNSFLRTTPNVLVVWPVNQMDFAQEAIERLKVAGGESALGSSPIHVLVGLAKERYFDALQLLLNATDTRLEDAAISEEEARNLVESAQRVGEYLRQVQQLVVSRYDLGEIGSKLPRLMIAITSNDDTYAACRLLRRGTRFMVDPDKLLQFSRANVADDWRRRPQANPRTGLAFISALFEVQLVNVSSSAVVNSCAVGPDEELRRIVRSHYPAPVSSNAGNSLRNSALSRALRDEEDVGVAAPNPSVAVRDAYSAIQGLTNRKHRQINESIVAVLRDQVHIAVPSLDFEHEPFPRSDLELRADVWFEPNGRARALEFTHRRDGDATSAVIASYVLGKIQDYARDFGLL